MCCWEGRGGGGTPLRPGHKESYKDYNLKNSTSEWDESILGILRCTICITKFNHLYLGTGCVCFFWEGRGGGTPVRHWHKESYKNIGLHRSKVKVTGTVHCFLKVQS